MCVNYVRFCTTGQHLLGMTKYRKGPQRTAWDSKLQGAEKNYRGF